MKKHSFRFRWLLILLCVALLEGGICYILDRDGYEAKHYSQGSNTNTLSYLDYKPKEEEVEIDWNAVKEAKKRFAEKQKKQKNDPYNVYDYRDAEDFYDDNYDDFWEYEEAEEYFNEHNE